MNYRKLKGRIVEFYENQRAFAKALGIDYTSLNARLNNKTQWKTDDIVKACELLEIPLEEAHIYFFTPKVEKTETEGV